MEILGALLQALVMVVGFAVWALPIFLALWILQRMAAMSRDMMLLKRQLAAMAEHSGAPIVPQPPAPRGTRTPLWAFGIVLAVFLIIMGVLYAAPGMSWRMEATELETVEQGRIGGSATTPMPLPPMPEAVEEAPAR